MMYRALRLGKVGVVAPIASTEGAIAAVISIALGEKLTAGVAVCLGVVACGVVLVTMRGRASDVHLRPSLYALGASCLFGVNLVASSRAGDALGPLWTILVARIVGVSLIALPLILRGSLRPPGRAWWMVAFSAAAEVIGFTFYVIGSHHGVAIPAVLGSQFAAVATIGSFVIFGERIGRAPARRRDRDRDRRQRPCRAAGLTQRWQEGRELVLEPPPRDRSDQLLLHLAALEHHQRRDREDVVAGRRLQVVVDVQLGELDAAGVLPRRARRGSDPSPGTGRTTAPRNPRPPAHPTRPPRTPRWRR